VKKQLLALLMGTTLILSACGGDETDNKASESGSTSGDATADAGNEVKLYEQKCANCHGQDLSGGIGPDLTAIGSKMSKEEIETLIIDGIGAMPKEQLTGDDASQVAAWLAEKK